MVASVQSSVTSTPIRTAHGILPGPFEWVGDTRVFVVRPEIPEPFTKLVGSVCVPNRWQEETNSGKYSHMVYRQGFFEAVRGGVYTVRGGGALLDDEHGEAPEIVEYAHTVRTCARDLLASRFLDEAEHKAVSTALKKLELLLQNVRKPRKITARERIVRGQRMQDSRGRRNPSAASMAVFAAAQHLEQRLAELRTIGIRVDRRTKILGQEIARHKTLHDTVWHHVQPVSQLRRWCRQGNAFAMRATVRQLSDLIASFERVIANPYRAHAQQALHDLYMARDEALAGRASELPEYYDRLQNGLVGTAVQYALEREILAPLCFLSYDLEMKQRREHRGSLRRSGPFNPIVSMAPRQFAMIREALGSLPNRLIRWNDENLRERPAEAVTERVIEATRYADEGQWTRVKKTLKDASRLL